ncbi:hypothetical protein OEA41_009688 [Lepraria neglecta]|uniref:Uncharacterized protein n=1 Tax=Lepraria neglecta TaxID=209136 RepID=A0AAD9Z3K9_9LECA|nr:hypothetical protein OEA41_009688 [Lepraria neglecta]
MPPNPKTQVGGSNDNKTPPATAASATEEPGRRETLPEIWTLWQRIRYLRPSPFIVGVEDCKDALEENKFDTRAALKDLIELEGVIDGNRAKEMIREAERAFATERDGAGEGKEEGGSDEKMQAAESKSGHGQSELSEILEIREIITTLQE